MSSGPLVLVVDDEAQIRRFLRISLKAEGYRVVEAERGKDAIVRVAQLHPDVIVLDIGLPDIDGQEVLRRLREWTQTPVIMLSVRDADQDKVDALDSGADDYLTKPFSVAELLARLRVAMRRAHSPGDEAVFRSGSLVVDLAAHTVTANGASVKLTPTEYALLGLLIRHAGRVLTHRQILREVWGPEYVEETHYLRVYVAQLRRKLEENPALPQLLITEPGVGYRLILL